MFRHLPHAMVNGTQETTVPRPLPPPLAANRVRRAELFLQNRAIGGNSFNFYSSDQDCVKRIKYYDYNIQSQQSIYTKKSGI